MSSNPTALILCVFFILTFKLLIGIPFWIVKRRRRLAAQGRGRLLANNNNSHNPWHSAHVTNINGRTMTVGEISSELQRIRRDLEAQRHGPEPSLKTLSRSKLDSFELYIYQGSDTVVDPCVVCLSEFMTDDKLRKLSCGHIYHSKCIDEWLLQRSSCCPICKRDYSESQEDKLTPTLPTPPPFAHV